MRMRPFGELLDPERALATLLRAARPVRATETVALTEALGRVPSAIVRAPQPVPPFARATWDGYAVCARDLRGASGRSPRRLVLVGEVFAETSGGLRLRPGTAVAIAAGGELPHGADSVVPFEMVRAEGATIGFTRPCRPGDRIASVGSDFRRGTALAGPTRPLVPAALGALASAGLASVTVYRRPRVAVIPNGNELILPGQPLGPGRIYESNRVALAAFLTSAGAVPELFDPVGDRPEEIRRVLLEAASRADLVLATGGSSVGERDHLPEIFPTLGRLLFHGLAIRPGKPTLAAVRGGTLWVGLPGHPTSCLANAFWLLLPVVRRMGHRTGPGTFRVDARLTEGYAIAGGPMATVVPLRVEGGRARPTFRDSAAITSLVAANGFVIVPAGGRSLRRGQRLSVRMLPAPMAGEWSTAPAPRRRRSETVSPPVP